jgi:glycerol-3-phosphate dehydrogenase
MLKALEEHRTCKSGALTLVGGKFSSMRIVNSLIGRTRKSLMLKEVKTKKVKLLESLETMDQEDNNGMLSISTKQRAHKLRESTKTSDSMSTDHSTLFQSFHSTEWLSALVLTMSK